MKEKKTKIYRNVYALQKVNGFFNFDQLLVYCYSPNLFIKQIPLSILYRIEILSLEFQLFEMCVCVCD